MAATRKNKIDLHMLVLDERIELSKRAEFSVSGYKDHINLIKLPGILDRHMGRNRARGYRFGENKYVACLDDDDYLVGPLNEAVQIMESHNEVVGVYYDDCRVDIEGHFLKDGYTVGQGPWSPSKQLQVPPHHICVMRRSAVEKVVDELENFSVHDLRVLHAMILEYGDLWHFPSVRYAWTHHTGQHHKIDEYNLDALEKSMNFVRPLIVAAHNRKQQQRIWPY